MTESIETRSRLRKVNQGSEQVVDPELAVGGAGRRKSVAYTVVCEHFLADPQRRHGA
jgi:hypothetical protein